MRRLRFPAAIMLGLTLALAGHGSVAAQEQPGSLAELARAGAPLVAAQGPLGEEAPLSASAADGVPDTPAPTHPLAIEPIDPQLSPPLDPQIPNPLDLLPSLDPRDWAGDLLDAVITMLGRAILEAVRGFTDWALGMGDSSLNFVTRTPPEGTYESETVRALWELTRALAMGALAVLVMWGGLNIVLKEHIRAPYHSVMELLPRIALAALAASLTLEFATLLIDLNNAFTAAIGAEGLPGYDEAGIEQDGLALVIVAIAYAVVALLLAFQMLMRLALLNVLIVLAPVMVLLWVLPQTQGWTRWWTHLLPITVFQQAVQMLVLRLGAMLMVELTPGSTADAILTLLLGIAVCWLTLKVPSLLRGQVHHAGMSSVVSLVVLGRAAGAMGGSGGAAGAAAGAGR